MSAGFSEQDDSWRESASFDVSPEACRAAFERAVASDSTPQPRVWPELRRTAIRTALVVTGILILGLGVHLLPAFEAESFESLDYGIFYGAALAELVIVPIAILLSWRQVYYARNWRKHQPALWAQYKRPRRLRIRWNAKSLMVVSREGFVTYGWTSVHAALDERQELLLFPEMLDPVPVPHAALAPGDLEDLRARLAEGEVPGHWQLQADETRSLKRVFG